MLILEKKVYGKYLEKLPVIVRRFYSIFIVIIGWVFFYYEDMSAVGGLIKAMFGFNGFAQTGDFTIILNMAVLLAAAAVASTPIASNLTKSITRKISRKKNGKEIVQAATIVFQLGVLFVCVAALVGSTYNPFLYFRF